MKRLSALLVRLLAICVFLSGTQLWAQQRIELVGHDETKPIRDFAFSPEGNLLASCSDDGTVRVWSPTTGELLTSLNHEGPVKKVVFSPDGEFLATSCTVEPDGRQTAVVTIWNVQSWKSTQLANLTSRRSREVYSLAFSPDGQTLVTATSSFGGKGTTEVRLWDFRMNKELATIRDSDTILEVGFSPQGTLLAGVGSFGRRAEKGATILWKTDAFDEPKTLRNDGRNFDVEFSPDGRLLAVGASLVGRGDSGKSPSVVYLWNLEQTKLIGTLSGFVGIINSISFSPDGRALAATATVPGGWGTESGEVVQVWNLDTGARRILERNTHSRSLQFSPAGGVLATAYTTPRPGVRLWDTQSGSVVATLEQGEPPDVVTKIRYSPQGDKLAVANLNRSNTCLLCIWQIGHVTTTSESKQ